MITDKISEKFNFFYLNGRIIIMNSRTVTLNLLKDMGK